MRRALPVVVVCLLFCGALRADEVVGLSMAPSGVVTISTASHGEWLVAPQPTDTSGGNWKLAAPKIPFALQEGRKVGGSAGFEFVGGARIRLDVHAEITKHAVDVRGSWDVDADGRGFVRVDLFIPGEEASRMVAVQGQRRIDFQSPDLFKEVLRNCGEVVFKDADSDRMIAKLTVPGEPASSISFVPRTVAMTDGGFKTLPEGETGGVVMRIDTYPHGSAQSDVSASMGVRWILEFP